MDIKLTRLYSKYHLVRDGNSKGQIPLCQAIAPPLPHPQHEVSPKKQYEELMRHLENSIYILLPTSIILIFCKRSSFPKGDAMTNRSCKVSLTSDFSQLLLGLPRRFETSLCSPLSR